MMTSTYHNAFRHNPFESCPPTGAELPTAKRRRFVGPASGPTTSGPANIQDYSPGQARRLPDRKVEDTLI